MLTKRIVPCIDVDLDKSGDASVYTGINFEDLQYTGDPVEMAKKYNEAGADELIFLDITASSQGRKTMLNVVKRVADEVFIPLTVGGGISSLKNIKETLRSGADKVSINTGALKNPDLINKGANSFGSQCIIISIDAKRRFDEEGEYYTKINGESCWFECTIKGGKKGTDIDAIEWAKKTEEKGSGELLVNSIDKDGTKNGYDIPLIESICNSVSIPVIASSGCGTPKHMLEAFEVGADAALAASIFHFNEYTIQETKEFLSKNNIPIRS